MATFTPTEYAMLKADLGFLTEPPESIRTLMEAKLNAAHVRLARDGVVIDQSDPSDEELVVMYAAWLYRKRDSGEGKPQMLRQELNDRKVDGKVSAS